MVKLRAPGVLKISDIKSISASYPPHLQPTRARDARMLQKQLGKMKMPTFGAEEKRKSLTKEQRAKANAQNRKQLVQLKKIPPLKHSFDKPIIAFFKKNRQDYKTITNFVRAVQEQHPTFGMGALMVRTRILIEKGYLPEISKWAKK